MSYKSRGNWKIGICLKTKCINRPEKCSQCFRFSEYKERSDDEAQKPGKV